METQRRRQSTQSTPSTVTVTGHNRVRGTAATTTRSTPSSSPRMTRTRIFLKTSVTSSHGLRKPTRNKNLNPARHQESKLSHLQRSSILSRVPAMRDSQLLMYKKLMISLPSSAPRRTRTRSRTSRARPPRTPARGRPTPTAPRWR